MKEIFDNDMNNIDDVQVNMFNDIGITFNNTTSEDNLENIFVQPRGDMNTDEDLFSIEAITTDESLIDNVDVVTREESSINEEMTVNESVSLNESLNESEVFSEGITVSDINDNTKDDTTVKLEEIGMDTSESNDKEDSDSENKYVIDGDIDQKTTVIGYNFVDVEESEQPIISGRIEEVTVKENDFISEDIAPYISKGESLKKNKKKNKFDVNEHKKLIRRIGIIAALFAIIGTSAFLLIKSIASKINFTDFSDTVEQEEQFDTESVLSDNAEVVKVNEFNWDMIKGNPTYDENIYNILIVGGDIAGSKDARGNSDTLIIVSIDKNTKSIKLSSIMRDTYVPIPGYRDNKINSAYATGGVPLVKRVIEENFKVTIDSTVVVNYTTFVKAIDKLGGVKGVVLNGSEARFINRECNKHGHPSNLVEGTHDLDAYQSLHFARIRKISSDIYGSDDFGRTARQRYVINQLFKQYKNLNYAQLAGILTSVMGELEVDEVLKKDLFLLAQVALKFNADTLGEFRLPMDNAYSFASVPVPGSGQNMSVVKIDNYWQTNVDALHEFIYGTTEY